LDIVELAAQKDEIADVSNQLAEMPSAGIHSTAHDFFLAGA
jgi:hypothetical protein